MKSLTIGRTITSDFIYLAKTHNHYEAYIFIIADQNKNAMLLHGHKGKAWIPMDALTRADLPDVFTFNDWYRNYKEGSEMDKVWPQLFG